MTVEITHKITALVATTMLCLVASFSAIADEQPDRLAAPRIDVVIALDVSGSMSGLIESAKQRLWNIVNDLGRAQPQPELRLAILTYGNPAYGPASGYVRIDLPFTSNLDDVNETLFGFHTAGGDEYVARVIQSSVADLDWSTDPNALKIIFVAGNEKADQDPQISIAQATTAAAHKGIIVNTIYCGNEHDQIAAGWRGVAQNTNGLFASIDQNSAAVAEVATPMDDELANLNTELNKTYIAFGKGGVKSRDKQLDQDRKTAGLSQSAAASRTVAKSGRMYDSSDWDLVDATRNGTDIAELEEDMLPEVMQPMTPKERVAHVEQQSEKREDVRQQIKKLDKDRRNYIASEKSRVAADEPLGLDEAIQKSLRSQAEEKGFSFDEN